jgi:hypothetical protein
MDVVSLDLTLVEFWYVHLLYLQHGVGPLMQTQQHTKKESSNATTVGKFTFDTAPCGGMVAMSVESLQCSSALSVTIGPNRK